MPVNFSEEYPAAKIVYRLAIDLAGDPEHVALAQALTLNAAKPEMGLSERYGLFGSDE